MTVADSGNAIFIPAIRLGTGMIVGQVLPSVASFAVVLTNCSPRTLTEVGTPPLPVCNTPLRLLQPLFFCRHAAFPFDCRNEPCVVEVCVRTLSIIACRGLRIIVTLPRSWSDTG